MRGSSGRADDRLHTTEQRRLPALGRTPPGRCEAGRPDVKKRWDRYVEARRSADSTGGMLESALTAASGQERPGELGAG